jgi:hypothetical protein
MEHRNSGQKVNSAQTIHLSAKGIKIIILVLPFFVFSWMLPFLSSRILGNDYTDWPIQHQMELMFSLKTGSFPLYIPGFAGGQSAGALTLGQIFHPISHIASILPGYWNGKALEWNTFLRLLSLGFAQMALFGFLRHLRLKSLMAFILSFVTVYNLRMLDLFRYGASLESWTGYIFLCAAIGWHCLEPTKRIRPFLIIAATYWLVCSGHPQMMYYGLIGAGLFTLLAPYFIAEMVPEQRTDSRLPLRLWLRIGCFVFIGILLSSAYIIPFYFDFVATNATRVAQNYGFANEFNDSLMGTLNNFFQPLRSDVHGVFGGSSLIIVAALVPALRLFRVKIPLVIWGVWGSALVTFLYMQGERTLVHYLTWKYLPFASSFRVPGRVSLILPILFMLLLAWLVQLRTFPLKLAGRKIQVSPQTMLAASAVLIIGLYACLPDSILKSTSNYSAIAIRDIPGWIEPVSLAIGTAALMTLAVYGSIARVRLASGIVLSIFTWAQISLLMQFGTWIQEKNHTPSLSQMLAEKREKLDYRQLPGFGLASKVVVRQARRTSLEPFLAKVYNKYLIAENNKAAYSLMEQGRAPDRVIVEGYRPSLGTYKQQPEIEGTPDEIELTYSSFNRLVFKVSASQDGFVGLAYPYTGHWRGFLNNKQVPVYRANGATHAIRIPAGSSYVEFRYWSMAAFWGMVASCTTILLIGWAASWRAQKIQSKVLLFVMGIIVGAGIFAMWHHSLYSGENLGTGYVWQESPPAIIPNLAYGKPTYSNNIILEISPSVFYNDSFLTLESSGRAVDGERKTGSGFVSNFERKPYWIVDLLRPEPIEFIVIFENRQNPTWNTRPLIVAFSDDQKNWRTAGAITNGDQAIPSHLEFAAPQKAQYVLLQATGACRLALDEVEIYPPAGFKSH